MCVEKSKIKLTCVTPVLNHLDGLKYTLSHYLLNNFDIEYVIIDGGSSDGSYEYAEDLANKHRNISLITQKSNSLYGAFNEGIRAANGDFIIFNHCGDKFEFEQVLKCIDEYSECEIIACSASQKSKDVFKVYLRSERTEMNRYVTSVLQPSWIVSKNLYEKFDFYNDKLKISADVEFIIRIICAGVKIKYDDTIIVEMEEFRTSRINLYMKIFEHYEIKLKYAGWLHANYYLIFRLLKELIIYPVWRKLRPIIK